MSDLDPIKLKVAELREELKTRGLDVKGTKPVLVKRLKQALNKESGKEDLDESLDTSQGGADESSQDSSQIQEDLPAESGQPEEESETAMEAESEEKEEKEEVAAEAKPVVTEGAPAAEKTDAQNGEEDATPADEQGEEYQTIDETSQDDGEEGKGDDDRGQKRKRSRSRSRERKHSHERSRRSRSRSRDRYRRPPPEMDDEKWESGTDFILDRFNCDLNMRVDENGIKAHPLTVEGFGFMWAGVRIMYGVNKGKLAFEVKILENLNVDHLPAEESNPHVVRVGYSVDSSSTQLGEEALSYGYGGTGKASTECKFNDYGEKFSEGDVITAYLDLDSEQPTISYAKNGTDLGKCFDIEKETLGEQALFPHILTKNTEFECNFGQREEPWFPLTDGYEFFSSVPAEDRIRGSLPPTQKGECEILMMVGLPGAGKTYWADKHALGNAEKRYNVLGTNNIIDKMKVMGLPRKKNYAGRWDVLIDKATKCLNRMIEIAARKKRNYILDQTNVYSSARRRKMQPFEGFQRKAIVVVPTDEDYKTRIAQREKEEGKEVPEKAVLEMKANFTLPETGSLFDAVEFSEQDKDEIDKLVEKYRKEGQAALPPPDKRFRGDRFSARGRYENRDRRGGYGDRDRDRGRGGFRGGYRSGSGGGGGRYDDRDRRSGGSGYRQSYDRNYNQNRSGGGYNQGYNKQGSWGGNQGSWGGNQGSWGGNQGTWAGNTGYGNWSGYGQGASGSGYGQAWGQQPSSWGGQNYWGGSGTGYNQGSSSGQYSGWSGYGSYSGGSGASK